jgi:hypothetical protein
MEDRAEQQGAERAGGEIRRLDRAPGERYAAAGASAAAGVAVRVDKPRRVWLGRAVAAAAAAGAVTFLLTSFDIGLGLLAVAAAAGWLVGLALAGGRHPVTAGALAAAGMASGLLADGLRALTEGGVLAPWAYAWERFGLLAVAVPLVAALAGAWRGR